MRIHQKPYVTQILERFSMSGANPVCTLADPHATLSLAEDNELQTPNIPYREAVGSLILSHNIQARHSFRDKHAQPIFQ